MNKNKYFFYALTILVVVFFLYFIRQYLILISAALVTVVVFNPLFKKLTKLFRGRQGIASSVTILVIMLCIIVPITVLAGLLYAQIIQIISSVQDYVNEMSYQGVVERTVTNINDYIARFDFISYRLTAEKLQEFVQNLIGPASNFAINILKNVSSQTGTFFTNTIIFIILLSSIFTGQNKIIRFIKQLSPLDDKIDSMYLGKLKSMAKSMVFGTFVIATVQGIIGGVSLYIAGIPFALFITIIMIVLSVIPLGSGVITIPIGIFLILTGNIGMGIMILFVHFVIVTNIDNILRPKLVSEDVKLPEALTLLGVFAGLSMFGPLGFVFGPVVMIFIYTTLEVYIKYYSPKLNSELK